MALNFPITTFSLSELNAIWRISRFDSCSTSLRWSVIFLLILLFSIAWILSSIKIVFFNSNNLFRLNDFWIFLCKIYFCNWWMNSRWYSVILLLVMCSPIFKWKKFDARFGRNFRTNLQSTWFWRMSVNFSIFYALDNWLLQSLMNLCSVLF